MISDLTIKLNSTERRLAKLKSLGVGIIAIRPYKNCSKADRRCRVGEGSGKYIDCIRLGEVCNLAPIDYNRWRRLECERKRLRVELRKARARLLRLEQQVESIEDK